MKNLSIMRKKLVLDSYSIAILNFWFLHKALNLDEYFLELLDVLMKFGPLVHQFSFVKVLLVVLHLDKASHNGLLGEFKRLDLLSLLLDVVSLIYDQD
jgi:hypothetical protein